MVIDPQAPVPSDPDALREYLHQGQQTYLALTPLGGDQAHIRFPGQYQGVAVIWDAHLFALNASAHACLRPAGAASQFMDIQPSGNDCIPISIGLAVDCIDAAVAHRAVIMVQKYKRLHDGRHEYGTRIQKR